MDRVRIKAVHPGERVGSYQTLAGAQLAVEELVRRGYDPADLAIRPRDLRAERTAAFRRCVASGSLIGALAALGALVAAIATTSGAVSVVRVALNVALGALVGLAIGVGWSALRSWRASRESRDGAERLQAERFEVMSSARTARASYLLARWWNPAARPAASDDLVVPMDRPDNAGGIPSR